MEEGLPDLENLLNGNVDTNPFPGYTDAVSLPDFSGDKETIIQGIERNLADSVITALNGTPQARENNLNWLDGQTTFSTQQNGPCRTTTTLPQTFSTNGEIFSYDFTTLQEQQPAQEETNELDFKAAADVYYFQSGQQLQGSPPLVVACKDEPISPRPCSNKSASTYSQPGDLSSGEDLMNTKFGDCYVNTSASSSSEENPQTPKQNRGGRRLRRQYSRDNGLSAPELERRERRREQNRRAAEKCRQKNKAKNDTTLQEYQKLQSTHTNLQTQVKELEKQKRDLQTQLERHMSVCPMRGCTPVTSSGVSLP